MSDDPTTTEPEVDVAALQAQAAADAAELAALKRTNAFLAAGITPESGTASLVGLFCTAYDGELTPEAIKAAATAVGVLKPAADPDVTASQSVRDLLASGGQPSGTVDPPTPDPRHKALADFHANLKRGMPKQTAQLTAIDQHLAAAAAGDKRVLYNRDKWLAEMEVGGLQMATVDA